MLLYEDETQKIISAFYEVYNNLGGGFLECVYQDALSIEFKSRNIPFEKEFKMNIYYKEIANTCSLWSGRACEKIHE